MSQPFIPRDKPKSWVMGVCAALVALLIFGPLLFLTATFGPAFLYKLIGFGFVGCWFVFAGSWLVFVVGLLSGKYRKLEARPWSEQVW